MVVIKVGGSLLDWPGLPARLGAEVAGRDVVLVCGGGRFADALRDLDRVHGLGEARSHALALHVLDLTAYLLADLLPGSEAVADREQIASARGRGLVPILAPRRFLDADDAAPDALAHAWTTTTDAIAARVAVRLGAQELLLLKSVSLPPDIGIDEAARLGLVDSALPGCRLRAGPDPVRERPRPGGDVAGVREANCGDRPRMTSPTGRDR